MISIKTKGDLRKTRKFLQKNLKKEYYKNLDSYGRRGVAALAAATPVDTGKTAESWNYEIHYSKDGVDIVWTNSNMADGVPVAILIQYGHATKSGTYVEGIDFINPALKSLFDDIADEIWKEVVGD